MDAATRSHAFRPPAPSASEGTGGTEMRLDELPSDCISHVPPFFRQPCSSLVYLDESEPRELRYWLSEHLARVITDPRRKIREVESPCQPQPQHRQLTGPLLRRKMLDVRRREPAVVDRLFP